MDSYVTIIRAIEGLQDQLLRVRRFTDDELHNLDVLWVLLGHTTATSGNRTPTPSPPPSPPPSPRGPVSPTFDTSFRTLGGSQAPYSPGPGSAGAGLPYPPSGGAGGNGSNARGLISNSTPAPHDLIPPPPPNPYSGALSSDQQSTSQHQSSALDLLSGSGAGAGTGTGTGTGTGIGSPSTNIGSSGSSSWAEGNTLVNQRGCCPHCRRAIYLRVTSGMQAGDSNFTEAVLRFRVHILSLQEMLATISSNSSSGGSASTNTNTNTGNPPFSSTPLRSLASAAASPCGG